VSIDLLIRAVAIGLGATLVMDLWAVLLNRAFAIPAPNQCLVGRWLLHMTKGVFSHPGISNAARRPGECPIGWLAHYTIGAVFALGFPPFRGGPFRYVDAVGAAEVVRRMERHEKAHGERFRPAPLLTAHARENKKFHPA